MLAYMAMRIIAGKHRGRRIESPEGRDVRPTAARTREAIFNILVHRTFGNDTPPLQGRVADIFCGSGAMGLEALSRGAGHVTFVDKSREVLDAVEYNIERFHEEESTQIIRADSSNLPAVSQPYDVLILDPPYRTGLGVGTLQTALKGGWAHSGTIVIWEQAWKEPVTIPDGYTNIDERRYGNTRIILLQVA